MNTVDDLIAALSIAGPLDRTVIRAELRTALESALSAEYERGRSERYTGTPKADPDYEHSEAAQREQDAEPVAWLCELMQEDGTTLTMIVEKNPAGLNFNDLCRPSPFRVTPLYAAPPKRKPLTNERIANLAICAGLDPWGRSVHTDFARLIERAHGIGDE